jgi:hypothetical protein
MKRMVAAVVAVVGLVSTTVAAHHSYAEFLDTTTSVEGILERVAFTNPHTTLTLRTKDSVAYTATWNAAFQLKSMGVRETDLKAGDVLVVTGFPARDPNAHQLAKLREVRRVGDGWTWRMENGRVTIRVN